MRKLACITLDMEPDHGDPEGRIRLLEDPRLFDRFVGLVNRHEGKVTMFTVTSLFGEFGEAFRKLGERIPLEYAAHSHTHNPQNGSGLDEIEAAGGAFLRFTGSPPAGYRAPIGRIDKQGLGHLMDCGYKYDSSVYTSVRPGKFGYFNLHLPNTPFWLTRQGRDSLLEIPFTAISTMRVVYALSYAKLLGWGLYSTLLGLFGLPDVALLLVHPYNFYTRAVAGGLHGLEKFALTRNDEKSFDYFERMLSALQRRGYQFAFVSEICAELKARTDLPRLAWEDWK